MSNKSVSDFVAATMDAVLKSEAHKSLFGTQYKFASDENDAKESMCAKHDKMDSCAADDPPATGTGKGADPYVFKDDKITAKPPTAPADKAKADDSYAWDDDNDARKRNEDSDDSSYADDDNDAKKKKMPPWLQKKEDDDSDADDDDMKAEAAFDVAIDSLLTASAALDSVGMEKSSAFSLRLASLVVEAKKKDKKDKEEKKKDSKSDSNDAKDKAAKAKEKEKLAKEKEKLKAAKEKDKAKADAQSAKDKASKDKEKEKAKAAKEKEEAAKKKAKEQASKKK